MCHSSTGHQTTWLCSAADSKPSTTRRLRRGYQAAEHDRLHVVQGAGSAVDGKPSLEEDSELRNMILSMVDEPLAILIKLADRLHNMRTVGRHTAALASSATRPRCIITSRNNCVPESQCTAVMQQAASCDG